MKNNFFLERDFSRRLRKDSGFSLLELVVSVGVLLTLTVGGLLAYNGIINSARQAAVNNAAETVYNRAMIYKTDDKPGTTIQKAVDEWNEASGILPDQVAVANIVAGIGVNNEKIIVSATDLENDSFEIRATYGDRDVANKIEAVRTSPEYKVGNNGTGENDGDTDEEAPPVISLSGTILNYVCDSDYASVFPSPANDVRLDSSSVVRLTGEDGTEIESVGTPVSHTLKSGVSYELLISGKFVTLRGNECLRGVENIDNDSEVVQITQLGKNIVSVPAEIPDSVTRLNSVFQNSSLINDSNISSWNVDNVTDLSNAFRGTSAFNQSLSSWNTSSVNNMSYTFASSAFNNGDSDDNYEGSAPLQWNVSRVANMYGMFNGNHKFNQNLNSWNTGSVTNMSNMFSSQDGGNSNYISGFNNGESCRSGNGSLDWDTSSVTNMSSMFFLNMCFNQKIDSWNTGNVTNMASMFALNIGFDQPLNSWNVSKVTNMAGMFSNNGYLSATSATPKYNRFNQPLDNWDTSNVTNMSGMFYNNGRGGWGIAMRNDLTMWNVSKVTNHSNFIEPELERDKHWTSIPRFS